MLITIEVQFGHAFDCALFDNHLIALCKKFCGKYVKETRMPTDRHQREGPQRMASPWRSRHLTNALGYTATAELAPANGSATHKETRRLPIEPTALCCLLSLSLLLLQLFGSTSLSASSVYSARKIHRSGKDAWSDCLAAVRTTIRLEFDAVRRRQQNVL